VPNTIVLVDGQDSAHLRQLMLLFPNKNTGLEDGEETANLKIGKRLSGYVKVCQLKTDHRPKLANIIDERPKSRTLIR
jgi:hypothetical protein